MRPLRARVTGADGFAGRWLSLHLLSMGWDVVGWVPRAVSRPVAGVRYRRVDVADGRQCAQAAAHDHAPTHVFHLAAMTVLADCTRAPARAWRVNALGCKNVAESAPKQARVLVVSTCHVYGAPQRLPIDERHPVSPIGVYARSKLAGERLALQVRPDTVIARPFHHAGPGQAARFALSSWGLAVARGQTVLVGDLSLRRDYTDVRDVVSGYRVLATRGRGGGVYNLASGRAPPLRELLADLLRAGGMDMRSVVKAPNRRRPADIPIMLGNAAAARSLGWRIRVPMAQSMADIVGHSARV